MVTFREIYEDWKREQDLVPAHQVHQLTFDDFAEIVEFTCDNCDTPLSDDELQYHGDPDDVPVCDRCRGAGYYGLPLHLEMIAKGLEPGEETEMTKAEPDFTQANIQYVINLATKLSGYDESPEEIKEACAELERLRESQIPWLERIVGVALLQKPWRDTPAGGGFETEMMRDMVMLTWADYWHENNEQNWPANNTTDEVTLAPGGHQEPGAGEEEKCH